MAELNRDTLECIMVKSAEIVARALEPVIICKFIEHPRVGIVFIDIGVAVGCLSCIMPIMGELDGDNQTLAEFCDDIHLGFGLDHGFKIAVSCDHVKTSLMEFIKHNVPNHESFTWTWYI